MKEKSIFFSVWWTPIITHLLAFLFAFVLLPMLTLDLFNSRSLVLFEIVLGGLGIPLLLTKLHKSSFSIAIVSEAFAIFAIILSWPSEQLGNWKLQIAGHIGIWVLAGFIICACLQSATLLRK